jgi:hypothetical protein
VAGTLPSCPAGRVYDSLPTDLSVIAGIDPLGHMAPSAHTFPSDHIYFYAITSHTVIVPAYAPGNIQVSRIASTLYIDATPVFTDYAIYFYGCKDLKSYFAHIATLSPAVQGHLDGHESCSTYSTGGRSYEACASDVNFPMQSGDLMGYGRDSGAFDFGTYDYRLPLPTFAEPTRHTNSDQPYTACSIDYFTPTLKSSMERLLERADGGYRRVMAPLCGQYNQDVAGTAMGFWYFPGAPNVPEDPYLSLIFNNDYAPRQTISIGRSLPNQVPTFTIFDALTSGHIDRDFRQVTADGTIYCYDSFFDPVGQPAGGPPIYIIQMLTPTTLRIESQPSGSCGSGPWAFTSNAVDFQR